jgi:8-oxo-dGTP pyrophosphatase MutT (NUDIX family)
VPYAERLRRFRSLKEWLELQPVERPAVRALVVDERDRVLLLRWERRLGSTFWITPGGGIEPGEQEEAALRRELAEEVGLHAAQVERLLWTAEFVTVLRGGWFRQRESVYLVRTRAGEVVVPDLVDENITDHRWWTLPELERSDVLFGPLDLARRVRDALVG